MTTLVLLAALSGSPSKAWPCSPVPGVDGPTIAERVGLSPLIVSVDPNATLTSSVGREVPTTSVAPPAALRGALGARGEALLYLQPSTPLRDGEYRAGNARFTVSSSTTDEIPDLGARAKLELHLGDEDQGGECGDLSVLIVDLQDLPPTSFEDALFVVYFERSDGSQFSRLVNQSQRYEASVRLRFLYAFAESGHLREEKLCVKVAGVSTAGAVGDSLDLGCVDPTSAADPRVFRPESSGCSASPKGGGISMVWLLAGFLLWGRARRRS